MNRYDEYELISEELEFRREIEEFYLPRQLIEAIVETGGIFTKSK